MKKLLGFAGLWVALAGCAGGAPEAPGVGSTTPEAVVIGRAEARWKAMIAKDLDKAYEFLSPGSKAANPPSLFKGKIRPLDWRQAKGRSASCDATKCQVLISLTVADARLGGEVTTVVPETWLLDRGEWWLVFD
jgi:hypothetical protein